MKTLIKRFISWLKSLFTKKETPAPVTGDTVTIKGGYQKPGNK